MKQILLITLFLTGTLFADFKVGDTLPGITLLDQFDKVFKVKTTDKLVLMAFEKDTSISMGDYLKTKPASFLETRNTKYISDISSMPSFIISMFALPKLKKYPFSVMLINDNFGKQFNRLEGKVTVFKIKELKIQKIEFISPDALSTFFRP